MGLFACRWSLDPQIEKTKLSHRQGSPDPKEYLEIYHGILGMRLRNLMDRIEVHCHQG